MEKYHIQFIYRLVAIIKYTLIHTITYYIPIPEAICTKKESVLKRRSNDRIVQCCSIFFIPLEKAVSIKEL